MRIVHGLAACVFLLAIFGSVTPVYPQTGTNLTDMTVTEVAAAIRSGEVTSEALTRALIERIERYSSLNAFTWLDTEAALEAAQQADDAVRNGEALGPLHGVPLVIKANIELAGVPTTAGTPALAEHIPASDAPVITALMDAGAIIIGQTSMDELAMHTTGTTGSTGSVRNPYNPLMFPGGSSSGTAAAVAAHLAPAGLGTDTAGSVRMPASLTGIYAFRPSQGRYPIDGVVPLSSSRDTVGPMARSANDIAVLDAVLSGDAEVVQPAELSDLRLGVPRAYFYEDLHPETDRLIAATLEQLRAAGITLVEIEIPDLAALQEATQYPITAYEFPRDMAAYLEGTGITFDQLADGIAATDISTWALFITMLEPVSDAAYETALQQRDRLRQAIAATFATNELDAIIFPTTPLPARPISSVTESFDLSAPRIPLGDTLAPTLYYSRNTDIASNADLPGLTLPIGLTADGLPVGIEINGLNGEDRHILAVGLALETLIEPLPAPMLP